MILKVENATFGYEKNKTLLNNINFSLNKGEILSILGPNGAGKTTLLHCIIGLNKWWSGKTTLDGVSVNDIPKRRLWSKISYVPQSKNANSAYTVEETVLLGRTSSLGVFDKPNEVDIIETEETLKKLGIYKLKNKLCSEISGGELQMTLIAKALVSKPEIIILDEPESNLDFKNQLIVLNTITDLSSENVACIFNTHYPNHALQKSHKSLLLDGNGNAYFGNTVDIVTESNIENCFGVKAKIDEIETDNSTLRNVTAISVADKNIAHSDKVVSSLAVVSIVAEKNADISEVNKTLHEYQQYIVGRMGMPYKKYGVNIININLDGPVDVLKTISAKLSCVKNINIKTVYVENKE